MKKKSEWKKNVKNIEEERKHCKEKKEINKENTKINK